MEGNYPLQWERKLRGSFTVEAALVMPMVILIIFSIFYLTFYLHDRNRIQSSIDRALYRAGFMTKHKSNMFTGEIYYENINDRTVLYSLVGDTGEIENDIRRYVQDSLSSGLFLSKVREVEVEVGKFSITIQIKVQTDDRIPLMKFFQPKGYERMKSKFQVHDPAEAIRISEVILDTGGKVKGVKELKEKLDQLHQ
ncbi:MAG: pilus assembly protein [Clostridiales bacterium]|jgi:hypothetical protein|nr:pilus assembly protein [Clostridiales bacterium]